MEAGGVAALDTNGSLVAVLGNRSTATAGVAGDVPRLLRGQML